MRWISRLILLVVLVILPRPVQANDWPVILGDNLNHNTSLAEAVNGLGFVGSIGSKYGQPVIAGDTLLVGDGTAVDRYITAYNLPDMSIKWRYYIGIAYPRQVVVDKDRVYLSLSTEARLMTLSLANGEALWQTSLPGEQTIRYGAVVTDSGIYLAGSKLYKLNLGGSILWSANYDVASPLAISGDLIIARTHDQKIVELKSSTGQQVWQYDTGTTYGTAALITDDSVYLGTYQAVIALSLTSGQLLWQRNLTAERPFVRCLTLLPSGLAYSTSNGDITAVDFSGQTIWQKQYNTNSFGGNGWQISCLSWKNQIIGQVSPTKQGLMNSSNGDLIWQLPLLGGGKPVASTNKWFVLNSDDTASIWTAEEWQNPAIPLPSPSPISSPILSPIPSLSPPPLPSPSPNPSPTPGITKPLVLVPGLLESWPIFGSWQFDPILGIYKKFIQNLHQIGYVDNQTLFYFPYDWHQPNQDSANKLKTLIANIKQQTGSSRVDIVAHSMGGLVTASYIESPSYNHDIDHFIAIASPFKGSVKAYLTWENGSFGSGTVEQLKKQFIEYEAIKAGYGGRLVDYIHDKFQAAGQLLPIFSYRQQNDQLLSYSPCTGLAYPCNQFLEQLNDQKSVIINQSHFSTIIGRQAQANTLNKVIISPDWQSEAGWPHGKPLNWPSPDGLGYDTGDGTVLPSSAHLDDTVNATELQADHMGIITQATQTVVKSLTGLDLPPENNLSPDPIAGSYLFIKVFSPVTVSINKQPLSQFGVSELINLQPDTDHSLWLLPNPNSSNYQLTVTGTGSGTYRIETDLIQKDEVKTASVERVTTLGQTEQYSLSLVNNAVTLKVVQAATTPAFNELALDGSPRTVPTARPSDQKIVILAPPTQEPAASPIQTKTIVSSLNKLNMPTPETTRMITPQPLAVTTGMPKGQIKGQQIITHHPWSWPLISITLGMAILILLAIWAYLIVNRPFSESPKVHSDRLPQ